MGILINIIYGIVSGLIASLLFELLRSNSNWFPGPSEAPKYVEPELPDEKRANNRAKLGFAFFNVSFYFYTFFIVYMALLVPLMFKTLFNKNVVYLSDMRFIGHLLPNIEINSSYVQSSFIFIALAIYIPILFIVSKLSVPIASVVDKFKPVNIYRWRRIQSLVFIFFSSFLSISSIYLFNETTIKDAFFTFLFFVALSIVFASGAKKWT